MSWLSSQELACLLKRKTKIFAIKWAKKEKISYSRKNKGLKSPYRFNRKEVEAKLVRMSKVVTTREALNILGIYRGTLRQWIKQGYLKPVSRGERNTLLFEKSQIVHFKPKTKIWLPWQKASLRTCYYENGLFCDQIAKKLDKSPSGVRSQASRLGLGKNNQREFYFLKDAAEFFGTNRFRVGRWIQSKKLEAVSLISSGGRIRYRISLEQIAQFMVHHPQAWQGLTPLINLPQLSEYKKFNKKLKS